MIKLVQGRKQDLTKVVVREKFGFMRLTLMDLEAVLENVSSEAGAEKLKAKFNTIEKHRVSGQLYDLEGVMRSGVTECCEELHTYLRVSLKDVARRLSSIKKLDVQKDKVNGVMYYGVGLKDLTSTISYDEFNMNPSTDIQEIFSSNRDLQYKNWICYSPTLKDYLLNEEGVEYFIENSNYIDKTFKEEVVEQVKKKMVETLPKLRLTASR